VIVYRSSRDWLNELLLFWASETAIGELAAISAGIHPKSYSKNMDTIN
jgi:hypothetical protein